MSTVGVERVLVVPTELFRSLGYFQGFSSDVEKYLPTLLDPAHTSYRPRDEMESDPSFKQLIPYVIFQHRSPDGIEMFQYTRGSGQGEVRLRARKSIGIGGHISTDDDDTNCVYAAGMQRELEEETIINTTWTARQVGMINDDETDVGRVHLGVVHIFDVNEPAVKARESEIVDAGFRPLPEIMDELDRYESWSQICLQALFGRG